MFVGSNNNCFAYAQIKHSLNLSAARDSVLADVVGQFTRQTLAENEEPKKRPWDRKLDVRLAGAMLYAFMAPQSDGPLIGASGAVSGVVIAYLLLYPRVYVFGLVLSILPLRIPAMFCVTAWVLLQIFSAFAGGEGEVAWWAHVGGLAAGAALTPFFKRRDVPLFSRQTG